MIREMPLGATHGNADCSSQMSTIQQPNAYSSVPSGQGDRSICNFWPHRFEQPGSGVGDSPKLPGSCRLLQLGAGPAGGSGHMAPCSGGRCGFVLCSRALRLHFQNMSLRKSGALVVAGGWRLLQGFAQQRQVDAREKRCITQQQV